MARITVTPDNSDTVLFDERHVGAVHLESQESAVQFLQRLEWAIRDANERFTPGGSRGAGHSIGSPGGASVHPAVAALDLDHAARADEP